MSRDRGVPRVFLMEMLCWKVVETRLAKRRPPVGLLTFLFCGWYVTRTDGSAPNETENDSRGLTSYTHNQNSVTRNLFILTGIFDLATKLLFMNMLALPERNVNSEVFFTLA